MTIGLLSRAFWRPQPLRLPPGRNLTQLTSSAAQPLQPFRFRLHNNYNRPPQQFAPRRTQTTKAEQPSHPQTENKQLREPHTTKAEALPEAEAHKSLPSPGPAKDDPIPISSNVTPLPLWQRLGPLTWAADSYGRAQRRRPYVTQLLSALVIAFCADMSVQRMNRGEPYDPKRTVRSLIIGAISAIPGYKWFVFLAHNFNYTSRALSLITKVSVNQIVFTPIFNTYFFGMQALLAGESLETSWARVQQTVPVSVVNSLKVWPAVTAFSFTFVPLEYRSIFAGVFAVGWQTYLMFLNRKAEDKTHSGEAGDALRAAAATSKSTTPSISGPAMASALVAKS
ncbi:hypothetical protein SBRCBS47491_001652 [Sporothrix bragantina]|uniref:Mpv17/PMP22 family protein n=1 Tax=Sporothrix bragantina TaxID=671064 RepID=A0ABP0B0G5_9PEZI